MVLTFSEGLLAGGRERRAEGRVQRAKRYFFPHFTRGLRLHRYQSVALKGFFVPEKQCPLRLVVTLVFRFRLPFGKETKRKRWLTRTSTFRRGKRAKGKSATYATLVTNWGYLKFIPKFFPKWCLTENQVVQSCE